MYKRAAIFCITIAIIFSASLGFSTDFSEGLIAYKSQNFAIALQKWKPLAKKGDPNAQSNMGVMYSQGNGVKKDYKVALMWWTRAAQQGHAKARFNLGVMYQKGWGVSIDPKKAIQWYLLAAQQGVRRAQFNLGKCTGCLLYNTRVHIRRIFQIIYICICSITS